jgi:putative membrane protein
MIMRNLFLAAASIALAASSAPVLAQDAPAGAAMSAADVGAAPMMGTSSANYVAWAADSDMYEMQSSKLALSKSKDAHVRMIAKQMITDHTKTTKSLMAALPKTMPKVPKPKMKLSAENAAMVAQLKQAAAGSAFDTLYLQQQMTAHQKAWALHSGYATDGTDPALKQVATSAVPIIEQHLQHLKTAPGSM